jgi:hypothetical protein
VRHFERIVFCLLSISVLCGCRAHAPRLRDSAYYDECLKTCADSGQELVNITELNGEVIAWCQPPPPDLPPPS